MPDKELGSDDKNIDRFPYQYPRQERKNSLYLR